MITEETSPYAQRLRSDKKMTFGKVCALAHTYYNLMPEAARNEHIETYTPVLQYRALYSLFIDLHNNGSMRQVQYNYAFSKIPDAFFAQDEINIIIYDCGQAEGLMC